ncbi:MAG: hemerythrin domain-containing protein [Planctomycetes bacterium]|nr:hemerythrin domain-containing protein [Planctomycetota bacterium]
MTADTIAQFLTDDHRACDGQLAAVEAHVQQKRWAEAAAAWTTFEQALRCHFAREEQVLFPAFEQTTGQRGGPTTVMRMEHEQMRALLGPLGTAVRGQQARAFLDAAESLLLLIQQHNMKEEQILYPMCDRFLADGAGMRQKLAALRPDQG